MELSRRKLLFAGVAALVASPTLAQTNDTDRILNNVAYTLQRFFRRYEGHLVIQQLQHNATSPRANESTRNLAINVLALSDFIDNGSFVRWGSVDRQTALICATRHIAWTLQDRAELTSSYQQQQLIEARDYIVDLNELVGGGNLILNFDDCNRAFNRIYRRNNIRLSRRLS
jgi:hypothetical protein